jgi:hypothetical protein
MPSLTSKPTQVNVEQTSKIHFERQTQLRFEEKERKGLDKGIVGSFFRPNAEVVHLPSEYLIIHIIISNVSS